MSLWLFMLAPAIGLMLALFGAGGGMVAVPLLVYGLGMPLKHAVFVSVLGVGSVSALALFRLHAWEGLHARLLAYLGVGGGFLYADFRQAVHHSLLLVMLNAVVAGSLYMGQPELPWQPVLWIVGLAAAGCLAGQTLAGRPGAERLQAIFRVALVVVGGMMLYDAMELGAMTP